MRPEWLVRFTSRDHLATLFSDLLLFSLLLLADGWVLVMTSRHVGVFASLAWHGSVAIGAAIILGNSIHHHLRRIHREARTGEFRPRHYGRLLAIVIGAVLLVIPGFVSDALGLVLYLPPGRHLFGWIISATHRETLHTVYEYFKLAVFSDDREGYHGAPPPPGE